MATDANRSALILAHLRDHGPTAPPEIARQLKKDSTDVWRSVLRMANAGHITFDETGRIASLTPAADRQEPTT